MRLRSTFVAVLCFWSVTCVWAHPIDVSIINLIASPEKFEGKHVRIIGFVRLEFEGDSIYLHREDYQHRLLKNGLWLDVEGVSEKRLAGIDGKYALVEGVFSSKELGHGDLWSGSTRQVNRIEVMKGR